jgi:hypothetical protein
MAVMTHGGVLPDSSQKTDFYGLIDNGTVSSIVSADISASAGIMDTQLNTISTAGKVNVSALTGQIANANLAQLTTAALVSGAALTLLPNIPSGAGLVPTANIGSLIGAPISKSLTTAYLAATDGIVVCYSYTTGQAIENTGYSNSNSSPASQNPVIKGDASTSGSIPMTFLVQKNTYWQVNSTQTPTVLSLLFYPIGS